MPGGREVGLQSHINHHATQTEDYGHLDQALSEVLFKILHGLHMQRFKPPKYQHQKIFFFFSLQSYDEVLQFSPISQLHSWSACRCRRSTCCFTLERRCYTISCVQFLLLETLLPVNEESSFRTRLYLALSMSPDL